jgi:hypothetical protein
LSGMKMPQQQTSAQQSVSAGVDAAKSSSAPGSRASPVPVAAQANMSSSPAQSGAHSLLRAPSSPVGPGVGQAGAGPGHREKGVKARRAAAGSEVRSLHSMQLVASSKTARPVGGHHHAAVYMQSCCWHTLATAACIT